MESLGSVIMVIVLIAISAAVKGSKAKQAEAARRAKAKQPAPPPPVAQAAPTVPPVGIVPPDMNWTPFEEAASHTEPEQLSEEGLSDDMEGPYEMREGHEECDPTEGSIEILGHSPEGISLEMPETNDVMPLKNEERTLEAAPRVSVQQLRAAIVMNEILGKPVSMRR